MSTHMRHLILFLYGILLSIYAFSQNQNDQRIVLTNGTVINGQVEKQADGSYQVITSNNDVFYFLPSEVSRVLGVAKENGTKKNVNNDSVVKRHGNLLRYENSKIPLTPVDFSSTEEWESYMNIQKKGKTGMVLWLSGLGAFGISILGLAAGAEGQLPAVQYPSIVLFFASIGVHVTGSIMTISSNIKLNRLANSYNQKSEAKLSFGAQQHGIGFALNF